MKISIGIKAYNEERHIARAIQSALDAVAPWRGEVILADSGSTDETIEVARRFPIRLVQLADPSERCCGAGAQLAFQASHGEYFLLMDGDMVLDSEFLQKAMEFMEESPSVAGVGGGVVEQNIENSEFRVRAATLKRDQGDRLGPVDRLEGGGLYRRAAIENVGYFADRNLHALEEFELGTRLQKAGWTLVRIDQHAVDHFGHTQGTLKLLWLRLESGNMSALGEIFRIAVEQNNFSFVLYRLAHMRHAMVVLCWWGAIFILALSSVNANIKIGITCFVFLTPLIFLYIRRGSVYLSIYSFLFWNLSAIGLMTGLFHHRIIPNIPLRFVSIKSNG